MSTAKSVPARNFPIIVLKMYLNVHVGMSQVVVLAIPETYDTAPQLMQPKRVLKESHSWKISLEP